MLLSKTSIYAFRILSFMATQDHEVYSAKLLYNNLNIPERYLKRLLTDLSKSGFISSTRGRNGGFVFCKRLDEIYLHQIIDAVEGFESFNLCLIGNYQCELENPCPMHKVWAETKEKILNTLTQTTLADLKNKNIESF